jgi:lipopolysaccharide/colanic/teichoic acid biosynthesis glycosyltransferase
MYLNYIKRLFDILISTIGFVSLSPIFIFVTIGLFFANQGKPYFFQLRPGKNGAILKSSSSKQ